MPQLVTRSARKTIAKQLTLELTDARESYDQCAEKYESLIRRCKVCIPPSAIDSLADPSITDALEVQRRATERYRKALETFHKFVLHSEFLDRRTENFDRLTSGYNS